MAINELTSSIADVGVSWVWKKGIQGEALEECICISLTGSSQGSWFRKASRALGYEPDIISDVIAPLILKEVVQE